MKVANKQKAIRKGNEYLSALRELYDHDHKAFLYIYTWVDCDMDMIIDRLQIKRSVYNPRIDWQMLITDLENHIYCRSIDQRVKDDALDVLSNPILMDIYEEFRSCFK